MGALFAAGPFAVLPCVTVIVFSLCHRLTFAMLFVVRAESLCTYLSMNLLSVFLQVLMQVLRDKIQGFAGEGDAARRLRNLWSKAWNRTTFQVMVISDDDGDDADILRVHGGDADADVYKYARMFGSAFCYKRHFSLKHTFVVSRDHLTSLQNT